MHSDIAAFVAKRLAGRNWFGLLLGAAFFAASLTPSMLPRGFGLQGVLGGVAFAAGYAVGYLLWLTWRFLELPALPNRTRKWLFWLSVAAFAVTASGFLWHATDWQNDVRAHVGMAPVSGTYPHLTALIAGVVGAVLLFLGWGIVTLVRWLAKWTYDRVPRRFALVFGGGAGILLIVFMVNGVILRGAIGVLDDLFRLNDLLTDAGIERPSDPMVTGSAMSLVDWDTLGREGRNFIARAPSAATIAEVTGKRSQRPVRVYVGLNSADEVEDRAELALQELIRVGGFDKSVLVIATPTGTGWMDPSSAGPLDFLHGGDVATVAMQYSYLSSYVSLIVEPKNSAESASVLFRKIYGYWLGLPSEDRPRLYLHGLSLGSYGSENSVRLHEMLGDPIHGALWAGPPFINPLHNGTTGSREPGSPVWLPRFGDGSLIRYSNQDVSAGLEGWGKMRIAYLQYASDPLVFLDIGTLYRRPSWMDAPRGRDVSANIRWIPVVTFLQLLVDMANATVTPQGFGHNYAAEHYLNGWESVTMQEPISDRTRAAILAHLQAQRLEAQDE